MPLYEHVEKTDSGEERVTERVRPAENSKNAAALAAKAKDDESGWRLVEEAPAGLAPPSGADLNKPADVRRGRGTATVDINAGGER